MIRNEIYQNDICISAECYDLDNYIYTHEEMGTSVLSRAMTLEEILRFGPQPLDKLGSLATLLTVLGILNIQDAANIAGVTENDLINEAKGWAAGSVS